MYLVIIFNVVVVVVSVTFCCFCLKLEMNKICLPFVCIKKSISSFFTVHTHEVVCLYFSFDILNLLNVVIFKM